MVSNTPYYGLEISVRQTLWADGTVSSYSTVDCPRETRAVRVNDCLECEDYMGLSFDREEQSALLHCYEGNKPTPRRSLRSFLATGPGEGLLRRLRERADRTPVSAIMSLNVRCIAEDVSAPAATACLIEDGFSGAPVVDREGRLVGVVSKTDLLRGGVDAEATVKDIMSSVLLTVHEHESISRASASMARERVHRLPVVDEAGKVVGLLSSLDILYWLACKTGDPIPAPRSGRRR